MIYSIYAKPYQTTYSRNSSWLQSITSKQSRSGSSAGRVFSGS